MGHETYYQLNKGVMIDHICGLDLMISTCSKKKKGSYIILNDDSFFLVKRIQARENLDEIVQSVMRHYGSDYQDAKTTIDQFIKTLMGYGYIREMAQPQ